MVNYCCCFGCKEKYVKGGNISFHSFPADESKKKLWTENIRRENFVPTKYSKVCSKHFTEECFDREKFGGVWLKADAVPTIFYFSKHLTRKVSLRKSVKRTSATLMDVVKTESEVDPLAVQSSDEADVEGTNPSSNEENSSSSCTAAESADSSSAPEWKVKVEENAEAFMFPVEKCETEEESFGVVKIKEEIKLEVIKDDYEVLTERMSQPRGKYGKKYNESDLKGALEKISNCGWTVYQSSKKFNIPYNTLKARLKVTPDPCNMPLVKKGRPFFLSTEQELRLLSYVIEMQELDFGLSANEIRRYAFQIASEKGENPFRNGHEKAGWDWWSSFKRRYGISLRQPENLSFNQVATHPNLDAFYDALENILEKSGLKNKPNRIWNLDESRFTMVTKPNKIVLFKGSKRVQTQTAAEKDETTTVLLAVSASGQHVPPFFIFKGVRMTDNLRENAPLQSKVSVSKDGWINSDIFLDFLRHFVETIPPVRPVLILMDLHSSHISPEALQFRKENDLIFVPFPSHCTHLLQHLDVSIFGPLKESWKRILRGHLKTCEYKPTRKDFFEVFQSAMKESVTERNIVSGFFKSGIYPLNRNPVPDNVLKVSSLHEASDGTSNSVQETSNQISETPATTVLQNSTNPNQSSEPSLNQTLLPLPIPTMTRRKRKHASSSVRVFYDSEDTPSASS